MKQRKTRRPFARPTRRASVAAAAPVFQPLEPRKLLTTLYANPDPDLAQTDIFAGWVAMPAWYAGQTLDASSVEDRSVRLVIRLIDSNPFSTASVTILDLAGHPLFPWIGQIEDGGGLTTDITVSTGAGDDGFWGSDDDPEADVFGLDGGYNPGWRVATDSGGAFIPGLWIPDNLFHPVRQLDWLEDEEPPRWDIDNFPEEFTHIIPATGYWHPGNDGEYETDDDVRVPLIFGVPGAGTDDRLLGTADDAWVNLVAPNAFEAPDTEDFEPHLVDRAVTGAAADDGIADFNNGIGRIILRNTSITTRLVFYLVDDFEDMTEITAPFEEPDSDRIGVAMNSDGSVYQAPGQGSIMIGNPTNANWTVHQPLPFNMMAFLPPGYQTYDRSSEGIIFEDPSLNETMGRVFVDGAIFGLSRFPGALEGIHAGFFGGKLIVDGDLDGLVIVGHAGYIEVDGAPTDTRAGVTVGRVFGSFVTGGNNSTFVLVQGDFAPDSIVDKPFLRSDKVVLEYERDIHNGDEEAYERAFAAGNQTYILDAEGETPVYLLNDTFGTAQYIGRETSYTVVAGVLGAVPQDDEHQRGDGGDYYDYYSIAVERGRTLRVQMPLITLVTIQDAEGNILASRGVDGTIGDIFFTPNQSGVVYIVIENTQNYVNQGYGMTVSNGAAATLGEVRSMASLTYRFIDGSAITTQVGSIGSIRVGQDRGPDSDGGAPFIGSVLIQSGRHIWNITSGGFIGGTVNDQNQRIGAGMLITAQGDIAEILAGYGRDLVQGGGEGYHGGSFGAVAIRAAGDIGVLRAKARGDVLTELERIYGDFGGILNEAGQDVFFTDIQAGGSIGVISAENRILEDPDPSRGVRIAVGAGEYVDLLEAGAMPVANYDLEAAVGDAGVTGGQAIINTGLGGNVRFFRAPYIWGNGVDDNTLLVLSGQSLTLIDDSGAIFTVRVTGAGSIAAVRTHAVQSSVGVATARITANLGNAGRLIITNNSGNVEIGDVIVSGAPNGRVTFDGTGRTDVYLVRAFGGINVIENRTIGDIVAIDTDGVNQVRLSGNLGRTFTSTGVGPRLLLGPAYGIVLGSESAVGEALQYDSGTLGSGGDPYLAGAPFNQWLNGLAVRTAGGFANLALVRVEGTIVDVYSELNITRITANSDNSTPFGDFHGIEGTVFTPGFLSRIDLGDGLVDSLSGPFIDGLIAVGETLSRVEIRGEGHNILGTILARGNTTGLGIVRVNVNQGAEIIGAHISTNHLDSFFLSPNPDSGDTGSSPISDITRITVNGGSVINSTIAGFNINQVNIKNGLWDSNFLRADSNLNIVRADEFIFRYAAEDGVNLITVARNFNRLETQGRRGDMTDLTVDVIGDMNNLRANSLVRVSIDVDETLRTVDARDRMVSSLFRAGTVSNFNAMNDITRVSFTAAGPVNTFRSRNSSITRLDFTIDGPDGRLNTLDARTSITGDIRVSGEIKTIQTREGDIIATIETFSGDGIIRRLQSGRDLILDLDADNDVDQITVGRNFSGLDDEALKFRGNFRNLDVRNGTFDGRIIVEGSITGNFTLGAFAAGSEIVSRGSITGIDIDSDVDGQILSYTDGIRRLDIDGNFSGGIAARNGTIDNLTITGNVAGTIHADEGIRALTIRAAAGLGGGSGNLTGAITTDVNIDRLDIAGNVDGGRIMALIDLRSVLVRGSVNNAIIGAGEDVTRLDVDGSVDTSFIIAGLDSLGDDNALGGQATNADTFSSGDVVAVNIRGGINNAVIAAGVRSGSDGYATPDATTDLAPGLSNVSNVRVDGAASGTNRIIADTTIGTIFVDGTQRTIGAPGANMVLVELDPAPLNNGGTTFTEAAAVVFTDSDGDQITLSMRGPGEGMYLLSGGGSGNLTGLVFNGTASNTNVDIKVTAATGNGRVDLDNVHIQFADDADLGNLTVEGNIDGSDAITIDGTVNTITLRTVNTSGTIAVGGEARRVVVDGVTAGSFVVTRFTTLDVLTGGFGGSIFSEVVGTVNVRNGVLNGVIWGRDAIGTINNNSTGAVMDRASISTRGAIQAINAATVRNVTLISAGDLIRNVNLSGDLIESEIHAGLSLGSDGRYGGTGSAADLLTGGTIESARIQGSFVRSAMTAGVTRGKDRFYGTADDLGSQGFGILRRVEIMGSVIGSNFNSQSYGFSGSSLVESVRVSGQDFTQQGNVRRTQVNATPLPLFVERLHTRLEAETFYIDIFFNEDVDVSTILLDPNNPQAESAISFENPIDPNGVIPTPNDSYDILYDRAERRATVRFTRAFSRENPGIYTLVIDGEAIRSVTNIGLDANRDGVVGDDYMQNFIIGDAGDRTEAGTWDPDNDPNTNNNVDFAGATRLDLLMDDLVNGTGTKNHRVSFIGQIGDHPDTESFFFPQKFDMDVFVISLAAGDVFQASLTPFLPGSPFVGSLTLRDDTGQIVVNEATLNAGFVETNGGVYYLTIGGTAITGTAPPGTADIIDISNNTGMFTLPIPVLPINPNDVANDIGNYELNLLIFNDGNTGFSIADETELLDGQPLTFEGFLGFDNNGIVSEPLSDADVFDISRVRLADNTLLTQLEEGMTVTITLRLSQVGGNLGGRYEVGLFQTTETIGISDGLLMGAPAYDFTPGAGGTASDQTFSFQIPEAGTYAVMVQGSLMSNYELIITVDTGTQGDRLGAPYVQNILIELDGGFAHWFGVEGSTIDEFNVEILGFGGFEAQIISTIIDEVTQDFEDAGITVEVSTNPADFVGEDFTTVFLTSSLAAPGLLGIAQTLDPQNQSKNDEAIVFVQGFAGFFAPGQVTDLALALAHTISHEVGHTLGLRHVRSPGLGPFAMMDGAADPYYDYAWLGDLNDPYGSAYRLGDGWFFGIENERHLLNLIFDTEA